MLQRILGTIAGIVVAVVVISVCQKVSQRVYPMPPGLDMKNKDALGAWLKTLPVGAFLLLLAGYFLGSAAGGATAALIARNLWSSAIVGGVLTVAGIANVVLIPHPLWVTAATFAIYLPVAWTAGWLVLKA